MASTNILSHGKNGFSRSEAVMEKIYTEGIQKQHWGYMTKIVVLTKYENICQTERKKLFKN
jgi:hypothetical protein